ncbi:MAG: sulfotransferase [Idiomarina sp.]
MANKTFILCVGAQKAGTTWLWKLLNQHPQVNLGCSKEYHFFDALFTREQGFRLAADKRTEKAIIDTGTSACHVDKLLSFYREPSAYFDYFSQLLSFDGINLTGDFTPSYALLTASDFACLKAMFDQYGINLKVIFIMREPYDRIWSACRMHKKNRPSLFHDAEDSVLSEETYLRENYQRTDIARRTEYHHTLTALQSAFSPTELKFLVYERLFQVDTITELCRFFEISDTDLHLNFLPVNKTQRTEHISANCVNLIQNHYRYVVDSVNRLLPELRIKDVWYGYD